MNENNSEYLHELQSNKCATSLILDAYLIPCNESGTVETEFAEPEVLLLLSDLGAQINTHIQQQRQNLVDADLNENQGKSFYRWMSGGDGPVFGIHCSPSNSVDRTDDIDHNISSQPDGCYMIPHLRTKCRYGVCVNDEWYLIGLILDFLQSVSIASKYEVAIDCWDIDDGQVLLIEGAQHIPQWVDDISPTNCIHRCWIRRSSDTDPAKHGRKWSVQLLRPKDTVTAMRPLQLGDAIELLAAHQSTDNKCDSFIENAPYEMEEAILHRIQTSRSAEQLRSHRAAVVLPIAVAQLFQLRPDLISAACRKFIELIEDPICIKKLDDYLMGACENFVWTVVPFGRTAYAMIRSATSKPDWNHEDSIVPSILRTSSLEMKRYQRQCAIEATPHLRHGIQLGVRLLAGLHHCLREAKTSESRIEIQPSLQNTLSSTERRVLLHWSQIAKQCSTRLAGNKNGSNSEDVDWMSAAWYAGPNDAKYDLKSVLLCPVFVPEIETSITPLTCPDIGLAQQIRNELLRNHKDTQLSSNPPHYTQVDSEEWMWILSTAKDTLISDSTQTATLPKRNLSTGAPSDLISNAGLDEVFTGVQSFMDGTSTMSGVETFKSRTGDTNPPFDINPTVFMNILHTALKSKSAEELSNKLNEVTSHNSVNDPFFTEEDYSLMDPDNGNDDNSSDGMKMEDIMDAMDAELRDCGSISRTWDKVNSIEVNDNEVAHDAHVLSNLLKSIDAGGGGPGPMRNMLLEMGCVAPNINTDTDDDLGGCE